MTIQFKKCTSDDIRLLQKISVLTFVETYAHMNKEENVKEHIRVAFNKEQLLSELKNQNKHFFFLYEDDSLAGYIKLNTGNAQTENFEEDVVELERIYLIKAFHGKGHGRILIEKAIEEGNKLNASKVWLGVWKKNPEAVSFYKKMGFKIFGEHTFTVGTEIQYDWMMDIKL